MTGRLAALALVTALLLTACGPLGPIPGGRLHGEVVPGPVEDWSFSDAHQTIQVETRPGFPHSVTTICFTHGGKLYVPASNPTRKSWPYYLLEDPHVRLKIGDKVYLGRAVRVTDPSLTDALFDSAEKKYPQIAETPREDRPEVWAFRIEPLG